jgi:hypothetical protein
MQLSSWLCIDDVCWLQWSFPAMLNRTSWRELFGTFQLFTLMSVIISRFVMKSRIEPDRSFSFFAEILLICMLFYANYVHPHTSSDILICHLLPSNCIWDPPTWWNHLSESYLCCKRSCIFLYLPQAGNVQPHVRQLIVAQIWIVIEGGSSQFHGLLKGLDTRCYISDGLLKQTVYWSGFLIAVLKGFHAH